jgi:Family of unknown function (DUF6074)
MAEIVLFPLVMRTADDRPSSAAERESALMLVFPFSRRRALVKRHARMVRSLSPARGKRYLETELRRLCDELRLAGIDCPSCFDEAIYDLGEAVGRELHGPDFKIPRGAVK